MKEKFAKILYYAERFFNSDLYIAIISLLILIGWFFSVWVPMLCVIMVLGAAALFICKDTKNVLIPAMTFTFIVSTNRRQIDASYAPLLVLAALLVAGMIFNVILYKRDFRALHPARIKGFHAALLALIVPFAFGGVGSPYESPAVVLVALALVVALGLVYTFLYLTLNGEKKAELPEYMLKILFAAGLVVSAQVIIYFLRLKQADEGAVMESMIYKLISLGWGGPNNVAPVLAMSIPATLYFCIKKSLFLTPVFTLIAFMEYALIFTTGCRGAILFTTIALPAMLCYVTVKTQNKVKFCVSVWAIFTVLFILLIYYGSEVTVILGHILDKKFDSSDRDVLYREAIETFKKWPVFGAGWDYRHGERTHDMFTPYWYHSTFFQILASMGILGVIVFAAFYFWRYRTFLSKRRDPACVSIFAGVLLFDLYGMIDTNFFGPTFFIMLMLMTMAVELNTGENKCLAFGGRDPVADAKYLVKTIKQKRALKKQKKEKNGDDGKSASD